MSVIDFTKARYSTAAHYPDQWPGDLGAEVAFAGRSNVGKSSAINALTSQKSLAKTSKTPGRTQQIVFFDINETTRLVDLPGYGYAKAPKNLRKHWEKLVSQYLFQRQCLRGLVIPMDIRRPLTDLDRVMLNFSWQIGLPVHILLTKSDKLKKGRALNAHRGVVRELDTRPYTTVQLFSARTRQGMNEARDKVSRFLEA